MQRALAAGLCGCWIAALSVAASAQDYAREKRWADEIVPTVVVGDPVYIQQTRGKDPTHRFLALFADAPATPGTPATPAAAVAPAAPPTPGTPPTPATPATQTAIVLAHGVGVHPDYGLIGALRVKLNDAGFATLSIQMPVAGAEAKVEDYYPAVFDEAADRIAAAARWLQAKGYRRIVLLSHSMGAWMANEYLVSAPDVPYSAWICIGVTGRIVNAASIKVPTLDLYGENDLEPARRAAPLRRMMKLFMASGSQQVEVAGADHNFTGKETDATTEIVRFVHARGL